MYAAVPPALLRECSLAELLAHDNESSNDSTSFAGAAANPDTV
jgi:hypothetical protein